MANRRKKNYWFLNFSNTQNSRIKLRYYYTFKLYTCRYKEMKSEFPEAQTLLATGKCASINSASSKALANKRPKHINTLEADFMPLMRTDQAVIVR